MNGKDNIVYDKKRLRRFKITLKNEYSRLEKERSFSVIKDLNEIIKDINKLHEVIKFRLIDAKVITQV